MKYFFGFTLIYFKCKLSVSYFLILDFIIFLSFLLLNAVDTPYLKFNFLMYFEFRNLFEELYFNV